LCGSPEKAIRNGFLWLRHLKNIGNTQGNEFENAIVTVIDSLVQLHCFQGVKGILDWSRKEVGRDFFWLYAAVSKAKGRLVGILNLFLKLRLQCSGDRIKIKLPTTTPPTTRFGTVLNTM